MSCSLETIVDQYSTVRRVSGDAAYLLRWTVSHFSQHLGCQPTTVDLTDFSVSGWLAALESRGTAAWTIAGHRTRVLCLWRFAAQRGYCKPPGEVRREPAPEPSPEAWTVDQVASLLAACDQLTEGGDYFRLLISVCYESGLRRGDVWALGRDQICTSGQIRIRQHKTGRIHEPRIRPETAVAVLARPGDHPLACPWGTRKYTSIWAQIRRIAGIERGACQQLRRTGATWVAVEHGLEAAREFLGHRSPTMVDHYVDRTIFRPRGWLPPRAS